ncbi:unnamed protein product [Linum trigynum]|uniref:Uncharacterized protein n=1 Tax=Linum trigynum TaxID=586398 RepID=A0AAV2FSV9_9ROSI
MSANLESFKFLLTEQRGKATAPDLAQIERKGCFRSRRTTFLFCLPLPLLVASPPSPLRPCRPPTNRLPQLHRPAEIQICRLHFL